MTTIWRDSSPATVDADLAALWREAGKQGPVCRALMSNLVVVNPRREFPDLEPLAQKHPARTILLSYTQGAGDASQPDAVRIGLRTFGDGDARCGLELIAVHAPCAERSLPSIVRRLIVGDVPTTVWWACDLSRPVPPEAITTLGRQLVYDSALWQDVNAGIAAAARLVQRSPSPRLADLNWRRARPLRDGLARAFRAVRTTSPIQVTSARVACARGDTAAAWLMAGWLSARLKDALDRPPAVDEGDEQAPLAAALTGTGWTFTVSMSSSQVEVKDSFPAFTLPVPHETDADSLAAELVNRAQNDGLRDALLTLGRSSSVRGSGPS